MQRVSYPSHLVTFHSPVWTLHSKQYKDRVYTGEYNMYKASNMLLRVRPDGFKR